MNATIDSFTHCQICSKLFGKRERCPRILFCGHTFCHSCLKRFISKRSVCPTCKDDIIFLSANNIPINFAAKSSLKASRWYCSASTTKDSLVVKQGIKRKLPYDTQWEEKMTVTNLEKKAMMLDSKLKRMNKSLKTLKNGIKKVNKKVKRIEYMKEINLEKEAKMYNSKLDHIRKTIKAVNKGIKGVKAKVKSNQQLHKKALQKITSNKDDNKADAKDNFCIEEPSIHHSISILSKKDAMELTRKDLNENTFYVRLKRKHEKMKYAKVIVKDDQISFDDWEEEAELESSCLDLLDFISSRTSIIDVHKFIEEHKQELHNPKFPLHKIKFSEMEVKGQGVYFGSFKTHNTSDFVIEFGSLLKTLGCSFVVPEEVFLKLDTSSEDEVVIATDGASPRALNFLLLASGILDDSYLGTEFCCNPNSNEIVTGGFKEGGYLFPGVVKGIWNSGMYSREEVTRGDVEGWYSKKRDLLSLFRVLKKSRNRRSVKTFGTVTKGMEVVDRIDSEDVVKECGLLLDLS